jgi:hypothetical protein
VRPVKQSRVVRAAIAFILAHFPPGEVPMCRFDVVSVIFRAEEGQAAGAEAEVEILKNAFLPSSRLGCLAL